MANYSFNSSGISVAHLPHLNSEISNLTFDSTFQGVSIPDRSADTVLAHFSGTISSAQELSITTFLSTYVTDNTFEVGHPEQEMTRKITVNSHGITDSDIPSWGLLPVYVNSLGGIAKAQADSVSNLADFLVMKVVDINTLEIFEGKFFSYNHGLTVGVWYALSTSADGSVVDRSTITGSSDFVQFLFFAIDSGTLLIRMSPGSMG